MLLTIFLAIVFCAAISIMLLSAVAFIQDKKFFSSAPKEAQDAVQPRQEELFYGARTIGWTLFTFFQFFLRFILIFTIYKLYDMICFDYFLLMKFKFFQHYYPELETVYANRKYGYNIKSQLLKLLFIFPAASALAAWICTQFVK